MNVGIVHQMQFLAWVLHSLDGGKHAWPFPADYLRTKEPLAKKASSLQGGIETKEKAK